MARGRGSGGRWPRVEVLGVYPVPNRSDLHLVEVVVHAPAWRIHAEDFYQGRPSLEGGTLAIGAHYLSTDGAALLCADGYCEFWMRDELLDPDSCPTRLAFFLHYGEPGKPLHTPAGWKPLPPLTPMPDRLAGLISLEL